MKTKAKFGVRHSPAKKGQQALIDMKAIDEKNQAHTNENGSQTVTISCAIAVKTNSGKSAITLGPVKCDKRDARETMKKAFSGNHFQNQLKAALGAGA